MIWFPIRLVLGSASRDAAVNDVVSCQVRVRPGPAPGDAVVE